MEVLTRTFFIFLIITLILSSVTEEVKIRLTGIEGGNITFPDPLEDGFLIFKQQNIAFLNQGLINIRKDIYNERLFWSSRTRLFTLRRLQRNDSGVYSIDSGIKNSAPRLHELTVYEPIAAEVTATVTEESCTLLCSVKKAEETNITWYKDKEVLNQSSSVPSLLLTVQREDTSSYRCVAASPAENKTLDVNVTTTCTEKNKTEDNDTDNGPQKIFRIIPFVLAALVVFVALFIGGRHLLKNKKTTTERQADSVESEPDVVYTTVKVPETRLRKGMNNPTSSGPDETSNLTTLYSQLELKHMKPDRSAEQTTNYPRA